MKKEIRFFKTARMNGVVLWGISIDDREIWVHVEEGSDFESVLLWYLNVEFQVDSWKGTVQAARMLFLDHAEGIRKALKGVIDEVRLERDVLVWPFTSEKIAVGAGMTMQVTFSSVQRLQPRDVLPALTELECTWKQHIDDLEPVQRRKRAPV